ncbi:hydroxyacylglutathione hydrolase [Pseudoalteromonas sp.]|uniref:hydroxyacylglutathione hydrolase n=1 Tax=Pseudoalteromonas sp. TaxID=53249 RepID=UPI003567487B
MVQVIPIPAFNDNYIWALINNNNVYVVDPGDATPVLKYCQQHQLCLAGILITHHHWDHTNGVEKLVSEFSKLPVYGPSNSPFKGITHKLEDKQVITLDELGISLNIMTVPGHTLDHIAYYNEDMLFCGDTLFNAGCGRLFEGTPSQMLASLLRIKALPNTTNVYCTHEYTRANLDFAVFIEPNNQNLVSYRDELSKHNKISLPTTIAKQKAINPFLRSHIDDVKNSIMIKTTINNTDDVSIFAALRELKDNY